MGADPRQVTVTSPGVSGVRLYAAAAPGPRLVVIARTHGNEPVGDPVLARLDAEAPRHLVRGSVLTVRANEAAAALDARHTADGTDMNRLFDAATQARLAASDPAALSYEERRALEIAPLLLSGDAVLDLHSTSRPAAAFLVMRDDQAHATLALRLGVRRLVTGLHENAILAGGVAANVGLYAAERGPRLGFTFEAGQHTDPENAARAWEVTVRLLAGLGLWDEAPVDPPLKAEVYDIIARVKQAPAGTEPFRFVGYAGGEAGAGRRGLPERRLHSFEEIQADEVVLRRGRSVAVRAQQAFTMLMPAPATPPDTDLYYVAQPRQGGLTNGVARTDDEARREALAIERMLDLLGDDEFERGTTWVASDNQRLFDLCATIVGRTLRLDRDDPHRRLVVVGRGESAASDDAELRAGHRWRDAMRTAIADGMPMERIQLLRGAQLAWLDALVGPGMQGLLGRRGGDGVRMRLSLRQPHTASLLVGGDLELALRTGDTRHVRVALLIEAATVEPAGPGARVRVVRAGLVSTRPEVLTAANHLLRALRAEHAELVAHEPLRDDPAVRALLLPDGAIEAVADPARMGALREALYRLQLRLWCDQLRLELREPVRLRTDADLGHWLASTMAATGILDAEALRALAVRPDGGGHVADPELVEQRYRQVHGSRADALPVEPVAVPGARPSPPQPLFAASVTADDLERWVSWTRFVRACRVVPETRGKDLDLAFHGAGIRSTLARWFEGARALAAEHPGEVLVVVAGDGFNPTRDRMSDAFPLYRAHRAVLLDPNVRYLRIQHAQGTHVAWLKDFLATVGQRDARGAGTAALQFEVEHGASVNVVLVLQRDPAGPDEPRDSAWSLDGWDVSCCGVVLSDLEGSGTEDYEVGLFTERATEVNLELAHFGRAHCEGLLTQAGIRVMLAGAGGTAELEQAFVAQIARWIERTRAWSGVSRTVPADPEERGQWVARRLGLSDAWLARGIGQHMDRPGPASLAARALWDAVPSWPEATWIERADAAGESR